MNKVGLANIIGTTGIRNVQSKRQQKMDLFSNDKFKAALEIREEVYDIASYEGKKRSNN